ncbi:replication fork protection component Swi3-domain-containing protein [Amylocarpus encephaloides]|uniref:Chromosome segregation in meiosis protein n=1 Tax=Amylocarpus encephaloides TaxID=45428 RepID=A0A9P7Y9I6_9HELO|nr:replication fork protection component Swi3-domain-containing protein [Amylocarpus encephaloides]
MSSAVANRPLPTEGPSAGGGDEYGDLENYYEGINDPFSDNYVVPQSKDAAKDPTKDAGTKRSGSAAGLGVDEEIEVTRKPRAPRVKLDEYRLLSKAGIPKLRQRAKDHLRFKGKGHEYSDATRLLQFYQLWLDDLYPKARFLDALAMVEKAGHKKMMAAARLEWINEGKPRVSVHEDSIFNEPELPRHGEEEREKTASRIAPIFETAAPARPKTPARDEFDDLFDDDLYDATPRQNKTQPGGDGVPRTDSIFGGGSTSIFGARRDVPGIDDGFPEDDLDALMAEQDMMDATKTTQPSAVSRKPPVHDGFDDEMEAMAGMDDMF